MDDLIVFSVFEITRHLKQVVETQIEPLYVRGEISNFPRHGSGHIYFNLKDPNATLRCTYFRYANLNLSFAPEEGMEVVCFGRLTVYEKGGYYNLNVQSMELAGKGDLARQFELLKTKLQAEGLFEAEHKQPLPPFPQRIGIVTSPTGAALQDILNILARRWPAEVCVYPALVQGPEAPPRLIEGLEYFNAGNEVDLIILTRGGGSQEDLFCFNDEALARAIFASRLPVISAVGHEIDFTIADFVADLRAPTPSAAAELAVPDKKDMQAHLTALAGRLGLILSRSTESNKRRLGELQLSLERYHPEKLWQSLQIRVDTAAMDLLRSSSRIQSAIQRAQLRQSQALQEMQGQLRLNFQILRQRLGELRLTLGTEGQARLMEVKNRLERAELNLRNLSPLSVLERGYSLVTHGSRIVSSAKELSPGDELTLRLKDGAADVGVRTVRPDGEPGA